MIYAIIVSGGKSERMGTGVDKAFLSLKGQPVLSYSLRAFERCPEVANVILVVRKDRLEAARALVQVFGCAKVEKVVAGGTTRQQSVCNGLNAVPKEATIVVVHDGARPCVTPQIISETIKIARRYGSGIAAVKVADTIKEAHGGLSGTRTIDRSKLWAIQTPQAFKKELLVSGYEMARKKRMAVTDESSAVELVSKDIRLVPSTWSNIKITTPEDLAIAAALLNV
jgi:2-C-methyl-D-erythritol 4-phosphate cytidylyltransferase